MINRARDLTAGTPILALDGMPAEQDAQIQLDVVTNTEFQSVDTPTDITFEAGTAGKVLMIIGGGIGRASPNAIRVILAPETHINDVNGTIVQHPELTTNAYTTPQIASLNHIWGCQWSLLENLQPGQAYFARAMVAVSGAGNTGEIETAQILAVPCS